MVFERGLPCQSGATTNFEQEIKMQALARIHEIEHSVRSQPDTPVAQGGEVGGRVEVSTVRTSLRSTAVACPLVS